MVYKKYIRRGNKVFGPYYYESYRENGKVKTRFISGPKRKDKVKQKLKNFRKFFFKVFILLAIFSISLLIFIILMNSVVFFNELNHKTKLLYFPIYENRIQQNTSFFSGYYNNEKTIKITNAEHFDKDKNLIKNVYYEVSKLDGNFSPNIFPGEYLRVYFEKNISKKNDIRIYAKSIFLKSAEIEVYSKEGYLITKFDNISKENWYKVHLSNLNETESYDIFDLKILNNPVSFDYVVDPDDQSSENTTEWWMYRKFLNHTAWDGISYYTIPGLNRANFSTGGAVDSSPAVANGYVYVGSWDTQLYQLNASNVSQLIAVFDSADVIYSSPAVANGFVYVGSRDFKIYQLNASNVSQKIANFTTGNLVDSSPAVANGYVYVGSWDTQLYQLNASNISQKIANSTTGSVAAGSIQYSSPAVANGYVYVGSRNRQVYQLNASNVSQKIANFSTGGGVDSSPAVANGYVYVGSDDDKIYQLNASNISQKIANFTTGGNVYDPAVWNGYVYIGSADNQVYQLNASNVSQKIANFTAGSGIYSSLAVANGYVYVGSDDNQVYQLNASNVSQKIANFTTGNYVYSSPAVANGYVYIGSDDYQVYQLNASNISLANALGGGGDSQAPDVYLLSPSNSSSSGNSTIAFAANATDNVNVTNMTLYIWNSSNSLINTTTNSSGLKSYITNISVTLPYSDTYKWNYLACDNVGNCSRNSTNWTIIFDNTPPYFTQINNISVYNNQSLFYDINATDNNGIVNFAINWTTIFLINYSTGLLTNTSALISGIYWINISINDSLNNKNSNVIFVNVSESETTPASPPSSPGTGGIGGGIYKKNCTSSWECTNWSLCKNNKMKRKCTDKNRCNPAFGKPPESQSCKENITDALNATNATIEEPPYNKTIVDSNCSANWSGCSIVYGLDNLIENNVNFKWEKIRQCSYENETFYVERIECESGVPVKVVSLPSSGGSIYVEILDSGNKLISKLEIDKISRKLNILIFLGENYYSHCYDRIKNYDEDEVDCNYNEDGNCPACMKKISLEYRKCMIWFIPCWIFILILIIISILIVIKILRKKRVITQLSKSIYKKII